MAATFTSSEVLNAENPHPTFGYFYGPIPNLNKTNWTPPEHQDHVDKGLKLRGVKADQNNESPNPRVVVSAYHSGVCMMEVKPNTGIMCGTVFQTRRSFWRHQRDFHVGAVQKLQSRNVSMEERIAGDLAFRKFVLTRKWRDASFMNSPGYGPRDPQFAKLGPIADQLESIAKTDPAFATLYGSKFHRPMVSESAESYLCPKFNRKTASKRKRPAQVKGIDSDEEEDEDEDRHGVSIVPTDEMALSTGRPSSRSFVQAAFINGSDQPPGQVTSNRPVGLPEDESNADNGLNDPSRESSRLSSPPPSDTGVSFNNEDNRDSGFEERDGQFKNVAEIIVPSKSTTISSSTKRHSLPTSRQDKGAKRPKSSNGPTTAKRSRYNLKSQ
ncbi:hypothetical protein F4805DRAFT_451789 [Annulohypoxylon moriforme]|nr:hypothetical protein F4805DRAFT_451789 [Annulohypoxylon moriforme]